MRVESSRDAISVSATTRSARVALINQPLALGSSVPQIRSVSVSG
jgi:hypothetical protein